MRRGRRDPETSEVGDALDFWRVTASEPDNGVIHVIDTVLMPKKQSAVVREAAVRQGRSRRVVSGARLASADSVRSRSAPPCGMIVLAMRNTSSAPSASAGKLTIGALSRATGIPIETLRTWELPYGSPVPERKPSGHRLYALSVVPRLRRIAEALQRGPRAAEVVSATDAELDKLTAAVTSDVRSQTVTLPAAATTDELLHLVETFDADRLTAVLLTDWGRLSPVAFLTTRIGPLIAGVGDGWASGRFEIRHEHFLSERVGDLLRSLRLPFDLRATGPRVICTTLPGEPHGLGLQMAALVFAAAGLRVTYLGTEIPPRELATLASDLSARMIALSVSGASDRAATSAHLAQLRRALPKGVTVLLGGAGARGGEGLVVMGPFDQLDHWARRVAAGLDPVSGT